MPNFNYKITKISLKFSKSILAKLPFIYRLNQSTYRLIKICMIVYQLKVIFVDITKVDYINFN